MFLTRGDGRRIHEQLAGGGLTMKKIFIILMLLITSLASGFDQAAAKRELEKEQAAAAKYQQQLTANEKTIEDMINDAKKKDYQKRLAELRRKKYVLEYNIKKPRITTKEMEALLPQLDAVVDEYTNLLHEYETFVNSLN
jgi:hypothetical protein